MVKVIDLNDRPKCAIAEGTVRILLSPSTEGTRAYMAIKEVSAGKTCQVRSSDKTHVAHVLDGRDATIEYSQDGGTYRTSGPRVGVYVEPGEEVSITASRTPLTLMLVAVPKYDGKPTGADTSAGYRFDESVMLSMIDEGGLRERTFWVNRETGLSGSWDLQIGRMRYRPHAKAPRHRHHPSPTSRVVPEHFYFIEHGTGEVRTDAGAVAVGPGKLVLIPANEWHQLVASETGLDYIEFQAPFDFMTSMDDPQGKNWYVKSADDRAGRPTPWVQS